MTDFWIMHPDVFSVREVVHIPHGAGSFSFDRSMRSMTNQEAIPEIANYAGISSYVGVQP